MFRYIGPLLLPIAAVFASACLPATSKDAFIGGRDLIVCEGVFPLCRGKRASCRLDEESYIEGSFPGARQFMVETPDGNWNVRISLFLDPDVQPRSPGTDTDIYWYEPGCNTVHHFQLSVDEGNDDLFQEAGRDNVFEAEQVLRKTGDHLIEIASDSRTQYLLRADLLPIDE
jgi:hypothetical protein